MEKVIILKEVKGLKFGQILSNFKTTKNGIQFEGKNIPSENLLYLTEKLTAEDEKRIKDLIRQQIRSLLWNFYSKQSVLIN